MKFLILRFSSIGDIVLTTPVMRCLKKKFPEAEIHYATKKEYHSIVEHNPYLTKVHLLDHSLQQLVSHLKQERFDYVIDLHHNQRTQLLKWWLGVKSSSFRKLNTEKWLMVNFKINRLPNQHIVDRYLKTVQFLGVENDGEGLDYFIPTDSEVDIATFPPPFHAGYLGWVIGAKQNTKKFPVEKIIGTIRQLSKPVVLLGGKEDAGTAQQICKATEAHQHPVFNACGKFSLHQSASLVRQAKGIISNDTGLMHIAAAFKKPLVSIWGNTIPAFGMSPYYGNTAVVNRMIQINNLSCRPCSKLGHASCPQGHFKCMNDISEEKLVELTQHLFQQ